MRAQRVLQESHETAWHDDARFLVLAGASGAAHVWRVWGRCDKLLGPTLPGRRHVHDHVSGNTTAIQSAVGRDESNGERRITAQYQSSVALQRVDWPVQKLSRNSPGYNWLRRLAGHRSFVNTVVDFNKSMDAMLLTLGIDPLNETLEWRRSLEQACIDIQEVFRSCITNRRKLHRGHLKESLMLLKLKRSGIETTGNTWP